MLLGEGTGAGGSGSGGMYEGERLSLLLGGAGEERGEGVDAGEAVMVSAFGGGFDGVWLRQMDFIGGSEWCHSALVHDRILAQRSPHSSASRPPSPSGKALATPYKLVMLYFLMINGTTQSLPLGGRWPGSSRVE